MFYVYVLKGPRERDLYFGYTADLKARYASHQRMPHHRGWKLAYYEAYQDERDARERERRLKHYGSGRGRLKKRIARSLSQGG